MRMMTYKEANQILGSSLSPNNRCICKSTAINNYAEPSPLSPYASNRLVPVSKVSLIKYTITYIVDGNTYATYQVPRNSSTPTPTNPTKSGYRFTGWSPAVASKVTGPATYTAQFVLDTVTISFVSDGTPAAQGPFTVTIGSDISSLWTTPTKEDYTFVGWDNNYNGTAPSSNTTYTAQWKYNYTVMGNLGHGIGDNHDTQFDPTVPNKYTLKLHIYPTNKIATTSEIVFKVKGNKYVVSGTFPDYSDSDQHIVSTPFEGTITIRNFGYTSGSGAGYLGNAWSVTYSSELVALGFGIDDNNMFNGVSLSTGDVVGGGVKNSDGSYTYTVGTTSDGRSKQDIQICIDKAENQIGTCFIFEAKMSPAYSASVSTLSGKGDEFGSLKWSSNVQIDI